ncbi:MAG: sugar phosphate nucleotidyltransferase, partial [Candidatus Woesearchaeota archaeon]|nr:sugar phosphate nucleotidyltransferase [Candidatus Woesearchaeota archaeon]
VILAGGPEKSIAIGNEYRPTISIGKKRLIEIAVEKLSSSGFKEIFIIARQNVLTRIFEIIKDGSLYGVHASYVEEKESAGSADSLRLIKGKIKKTFLVVYADIIFKKINLEEIWKEHIRQNALATLLLTTSATPSEKGVAIVEGNKILEFTQKPRETETYIVFSPIFVAEPAILDYRGKSLEQDVFPKIAEKGLLIGHISAKKETHIHTLEDARRLQVKEE